MPLRDPLATTFNEMRVPTSRIYVTEKSIILPNWSKTLQSFWSHSSFFALEKLLKKINFQSFFTIKRPYGDYCQWNMCTYFQRICSSTRYSNAKLIKNISIFLVALLRFSFSKTTYKAKFSEVFLPKRDPLVATLCETRACTSRKHVAEPGIVMQNWSKRFQSFLSHFSVFPLQKWLKKLNFQSFFTSKILSMKPCTYLCAPTSRIYVAE